MELRQILKTWRIFGSGQIGLELTGGLTTLAANRYAISDGTGVRSLDCD